MEEYISQIAIVLGALLVLVDVAKRIAQKTPGKRDDEIVGGIEGALRKALDFIAGNHGDPGDPGAMK